MGERRDSTPVLPLVGQIYHLTCPVCTSTHQFKCESVYSVYTKCDICSSRIDLRDLSIFSGKIEEEDLQKKPVQYDGQVELAVGCSGGVGAVDQVLAAMQETSIGMEMPAYLSFESGEAIMDEKAAIQQKRPLFHFFTKAIELLLFGRKPYCVIGHVKVFRKKIPLERKYTYIPVPRTSSSYSLLFTLVAFFYVGTFYAVIQCEHNWFLRLSILLFFALWVYQTLFRVIYGDPGFLLPGYISGDENAGSQILDRTRAFHYVPTENLLHSIEAGKRLSRWETVNGVDMERKWCTQCQFYRPPRAAHCYQCGLCVSVHDHHCGVTGGCVGGSNICAFLWFTLMGVIASSMAGYLTLHSLRVCPECFSSFAFYFLLLAVVILSWGVALMTLGLMLSLMHGVAKEATTRERIQGAYRGKRNPYDRGYWKNLYANLCTRQRYASVVLKEDVMTLWADASESRKNLAKV